MEGLKDSSSTMASVKKGFSLGSARTMGDGAGDCDQGDGGACSNSSYLGVRGRGSTSSIREAMDFASPTGPFADRVEAAAALPRREDSLDDESARCFRMFFVESLAVV